MKKCNCGAIMQGVEILFYPKQYVCPICGGTLIIDEKGIQRWTNIDGKPSTYMPPETN